MVDIISDAFHAAVVVVAVVVVTNGLYHTQSNGIGDCSH
jgi:hypothetical protein